MTPHVAHHRRSRPVDDKRGAASVAPARGNRKPLVEPLPGQTPRRRARAAKGRPRVEVREALILAQSSGTPRGRRSANSPTGLTAGDVAIRRPLAQLAHDSALAPHRLLPVTSLAT